jgi:hypothetical protein
MEEGDGNDSFHQFTHRLGLGKQPHFDWLGALLKNPDGHHFSAIYFSGFFVGRKATQSGEKRCELVEGSVTVPR